MVVKHFEGNHQNTLKTYVMRGYFHLQFSFISGNTWLFIASYYRQLSSDIKMKIIRLKLVLFAPKARANKTGRHYF